MKTITIKIGAESHRLVIDKEEQYASTCVNKCSLRGLCSRLCQTPRDDALCRAMLKEISDFPKLDFPFGGHFEIRNK